MSSSHPRGTIALAEQLGKKSIRLIDAPVSGGQKKAALGTLMIMVGGEKEDLDEIRNIPGMLWQCSTCWAAGCWTCNEGSK